MIFVTESGKEIQVPSDYSFQSLEKFTKEIYQQGRADEHNRIIGFLKYHRYAIVDNNGDYYSIEELEDMLRGQSNENNV